MKVCILCYGLRENNLRLQPWRYISEIARGLMEPGIEVTIITDGTSGRSIIDGIPVIFFSSMRSLPLKQNKTLISLIESEKPDIILWSIGPIDYLYLKTFRKIKVPIIGLITGPVYKVSDITRLGLNEMAKNRNSLAVQMIYAALPKFFTRGLINDFSIAKVIAMSRNNLRALEQTGAKSSKIAHLPVGIDEYDLIKPANADSIIKKYALKPSEFTLLFFGSPNTIRGLDTVIQATAGLKSRIPGIRLLVLSRRRENEFTREETDVQEMIRIHNLQDNVQIVSGFLSKDEVKEFISYTDVVTLPFKIVPSDVPTSILESMAMYKTVISTNVDGIPEMLQDGRGCIVEPNDCVGMSNAIFSLYTNKTDLRAINERSGAYMSTYPKWGEVSKSVKLIINDIIAETGQGRNHG